MSGFFFDSVSDLTDRIVRMDAELDDAHKTIGCLLAVVVILVVLVLGLGLSMAELLHAAG